MLPCNFTSENYILIIVFKYNNYMIGECCLIYLFKWKRLT